MNEYMQAVQDAEAERQAEALEKSAFAARLAALQERIEDRLANVALRLAQLEATFDDEDAAEFRTEVEAQLANLERGWKAWEGEIMELLEGNEVCFELFGGE